MLVAVVLVSTPLPAVAGGTKATEPVIQIADVHRFYEIYNAADGSPDAQTLQRYIDEGSTGLCTLARLRNVTGERTASAVAEAGTVFERGAMRASVAARSAAARNRTGKIR